MYPYSAPTASPAIAIPSSRQYGSPSINIRSLKVPESPSSALQHTYLRSACVAATVRHLIPAGTAAPPRPRSPLRTTASTMSVPGISSALRSPRSPPCASYVARSSGSPSPTRAKVSRS